MSNWDADRFRLAVYRAEDQWSATIDRGGPVDFFGSHINAPVQLRFGGIDDVQVYADRVTTDLKLPDVRIRNRRGGSRAHYEAGEPSSVIAIPTGEPWAMRESVLLHEIAHHACVSECGNVRHDRQFTSTMLVLVERQLGSEAALLLRTGYLAGGVPV